MYVLSFDIDPLLHSDASSVGRPRGSHCPLTDRLSAFGGSSAPASSLAHVHQKRPVSLTHRLPQSKKESQQHQEQQCPRGSLRHTVEAKRSGDELLNGTRSGRSVCERIDALTDRLACRLDSQRGGIKNERVVCFPKPTDSERIRCANGTGRRRVLGGKW
ncbi:hypothetical protein R1flu_007607 [Riccia fluitans]|uniref:Uncharacterized protein n=1 Tax=Riccia fluitans TaxID=41844 RepID=A0ABD1Z067_9MARC